MQQFFFLSFLLLFFYFILKLQFHPILKFNNSVFSVYTCKIEFMFTIVEKKEKIRPEIFFYPLRLEGMEGFYLIDLCTQIIVIVPV